MRRYSPVAFIGHRAFYFGLTNVRRGQYKLRVTKRMISLRLDLQTIWALKRIAKANKKSLTDVLKQAIQTHIEGQPSEPTAVP